MVLNLNGLYNYKLAKYLSPRDKDFLEEVTNWKNS